MNKPDLAGLRIDESAATPRRPFGPRVLAGAVLLLVLATLLTFAWPLLRPARPVTTVAVRLANTETTSTTMAIAEAVGWVEPDPFPVLVKPLVSGRIEKMPVLEGQPVIAGETVIATLQNAALLAAFERAQALLAERQAQHATAVASHRRAMAVRDQHADHRRAIAETRAELADKATKLAAARGTSERMVAEARGAAAALVAQRRLTSEGSGNAVALERAEAAAVGAEAAVTTANAEVTGLTKELAAVEALVALDEELLARPVDLDGAVHVAAAEVTAAERAEQSAAVDLRIAERELGWAKEVHSPVSGIVLRLIAQPGMTTGPEDEGILTVYDPKQMRARIDVPLDSIGSITPGQAVELRSEITGTAIVRGIVQRIQHETDLLKNTLQVKIGLIDPLPIWRPETLCRARFLGGAQDPDSGGSAAPQTFLVPKVAVQGGRVFVFDPTQQRARAIAVTVVGEDGDQAIVKGELSITHRIITATVSDGESVQEQQP